MARSRSLVILGFVGLPLCLVVAGLAGVSPCHATELPGHTVAIASSQEMPIPLDQGWRFLVGGEQLSPPDPADPRWRDTNTTFSNLGEQLPEGSATGWFELTLDVVEPLTEPLALRLRHPGASQVFLDGIRLHDFGRVGSDPAREISFNPLGMPISLGMQEPGQYRLTIQYSCADGARPWLGSWLVRRQGAGFSAVLEPMGSAVEHALTSRSRMLGVNLGLGGMAFAFAVLHGMIFFFHRRHRGNLWFAQFSLALAANNACETLLEGWGALGLVGLAALELANVLCAGALLLSLLLFLTQLQSKPSYRTSRWLASGYGFLIVAWALPTLSNVQTPLYLIWLLSFGIAVMRAGLRVWNEHHEASGGLRVSAFGLVGMVLFEMLSPWISLGVYEISQVVGVSLILSGASLFLARRISAEGQELEELARNLENRVQNRTKELEASNLAAQAANRAKSAFLATMSHEIRTPMNAVVGLAELLGDADIPAREREMAGTLRRSAVSLLRLIDEILDLSRIESGHMDLKQEPFRIDQVLDDVVELFASRAQQAGLKLKSRVDPNPPPLIVGDRDRCYQILINLVGNALKFTEEGGVELSAVVSRLDRGHASLHLEVSDTGIGISEKNLESLFDPFFQVDSSSTRRFGGAGLGLAICKQLADLMGATLTVTSRVDEGTRFALVLTMPIDDAPPRTTQVEAPTPSELVPLRILLAEDNMVNQLVVRLQLEELGQDPMVADDGLVALKMAEANDFDVLVLDLNMPGMDGIELARRIRSQPGGKRPYIIAFTANVTEEDRALCAKAGMDDFLSKPAHLEKLRNALRRGVSKLRESSTDGVEVRPVGDARSRMAPISTDPEV